MAASAVDICNIALSRIGQSTTIAALGTATPAERMCALHYDFALSALLRMVPWPFATSYVDLAQVGDSPYNDEWSYAWRLPAGVVTLRRIVISGGRDGSNPAPFTQSQDSQGGLLLTDESSVLLEYTAADTSPAFFAADFADALAWRVAMEIAEPLTVSEERRAAAKTEYQAAISVAICSAMNERRPDPQPDAEHVRTRD